MKLTSQTVANFGQSRKYSNLVLVVTKFVNLILPLLFLYSSLSCLYFLYAFYQSGIKRKLAAFSKSNNNNNENLNKVFMAHLMINDLSTVN